MRTASKIGTAIGSLAILGLGWHAGLANTTDLATTSTSTSTGTGSESGSESGTGSGTVSGTEDASASPLTDGTYTGDDVDTRFGSVQVQVIVSGGRITDAVALQLTDAERRSEQISAEAEPTLRSEVMASQSADISNVSGATYTSDAYIQSLQSALDQAAL